MFHNEIILIDNVSADVSTDQPSLSTDQSRGWIGFDSLLRAVPPINDALRRCVRLAKSGEVERPIDRAAGDELFRKLNEFLRSQVELDPRVARDLHYVHKTLEAAFGLASAKRMQLNASTEQPLTVCYGTDSGPPGVFILYGDGCHHVCPDSSGTRRPNFRRYCEACNKRTKPRKASQRARSKAMRYALRMQRFEDQDGKLRPRYGFPVLVWNHGMTSATDAYWGRCACGREFYDTNLAARGCQRCQR